MYKLWGDWKVRKKQDCLKILSIEISLNGKLILGIAEYFDYCGIHKIGVGFIKVLVIYQW